MLDGLPTGWSKDLWEAAKTAGPFGNLLLICVLTWVSRQYRRERNVNDVYSEKMFTLIESTRNALTSLSDDLNGAPRRRRRARRSS